MDHSLQVDVTWLQPVVGLVIPLLVGLLVKSKASSQTKSFVNLLLSAIGGALATVIANSGSLQPKEFVSGIVATLVTSWSSYNGFYKGAGVTTAIQNKTSDFGVGTPVTSEVIVDPALAAEAKLLEQTPKS